MMGQTGPQRTKGLHGGTQVRHREVPGGKAGGVLEHWLLEAQGAQGAHAGAVANKGAPYPQH